MTHAAVLAGDSDLLPPSNWLNKKGSLSGSFMGLGEPMPRSYGNWLMIVFLSMIAISLERLNVRGELEAPALIGTCSGLRSSGLGREIIAISGSHYLRL